MLKSKTKTVLIIIIIAILIISVILINPFKRGALIDEQFPDADSYSPPELYPSQQLDCEQYSIIWYTNSLTPKTQGRCQPSNMASCTGVNYFGYHFGEGSNLYRDNNLIGTIDDDNPIYEDNNVRIIADSGGRFGFKTYAKNYFNIITNFSCDTSGLFEDADNVIECTFYSSRSQLIDVLAWSGKLGTDDITDLRDLKRPYTLQVGFNQINFVISQELIEDENYYLFVTLLDPHKFESDYNNRCVFYQQMQAMKLEKIPFVIIPKPVYFNKQPSQECPIGYSESLSANTLCIRDDLDELPCYKLPAPITVNYTYACSSSGQFIQILFASQNCPANPCTNGFTCEETSGTCIMSQIYDQVFNQCSSSSDCPNLCTNIGESTVNCENRRCIYENKCTVDPERLVNIIQQECKDNPELQKEEICQETTGFKWFYILISIVSGVVFIFVLTRLTRKKRRKR